ncbi:TPA: serine--tRNA ligase, partial [Candidatus Bipolaricaulota bacterium]|nr:serine--tRNA ligase [Candidatus Bipolaricaulota bacterium]
MLDIREIRERPGEVLARLRRRDPACDLARVLSLDEERRALIRQVDELRRERKAGSEEVARLQREGRVEEARARIASLKTLSERLKALEERLARVKGELEEELLRLPNLPHESVPVGTKEEKVLLRSWGEPPKFDFQPRHHVEL